MKKNYSKYVIIIIVAFMIGVCTNLAHPVTPYLIKAEGWPEYSFSVFFSVMSLGMLIFAPIWGTIGDRHGKRLALLLCSLGYSLGQVLFGIFTNIYLVIAARFLSGTFSAGLMVSVTSYLSTSKGLKPFDKSRLIPTVLSFHLVGSSIGAFLGGGLGSWLGGSLESYRMVLYIQAVCLSLFAIIAYLFFGMKDEERIETTRNSFIQNLMNVRKIGVWMIIFLICITGFSIVFTNAQRFLDYYYADLGKTSGELGSLNLVIGLVTLVANILITPILLKRIKPIYSMVIAGFLGSIALAVTFIIPNEYLLYMVYSIFMIYVITKAIIESASVAFIAGNKKIAPGLIMGVRQSFISLGAVIGPLAGGAIYYSYPIEDRVLLFYICAGIYLISAGIVFIIYVLRNRFKSNPEGSIQCESVEEFI